MPQFHSGINSTLARGLRALAVLTEDPGVVLIMHLIHIHTCRPTLTHIKEIKKNSDLKGKA